MCAQVDRLAHAQIAVVTIKSLDGEPIKNFATALEDKWKVGKKGTDRGLLLIFAPNDRKYRIEVGYGLEGICPWQSRRYRQANGAVSSTKQL